LKLAARLHCNVMQKGGSKQAHSSETQKIESMQGQFVTTCGQNSNCVGKEAEKDFIVDLALHSAASLNDRIIAVKGIGVFRRH
jgi:hypothetical protein